MAAKILLSVALAILGTSIASAKLRVIVTHSDPTKAQVALLALPESDFRAEAEKAGMVITETEIAYYARPRNLYNIEYMRKCLDAYGVLTDMAKSGKSFMRFSDLTGSQREQVRVLFSDASFMAELGPNVMKDDSVFELKRRTTLTLTNGRKDISFKLPERVGQAPPDFVKKSPSSDDVDKFKRDTLPKLKKERYPDALLFTFAKDDLISATRPIAIGEYTKELVDLLEAQRKAFGVSHAALLAALNDSQSLTAGSSWKTMNDETQRYVESIAENDYAALGFSSKEAAMAFLDDARIKGSQTDAFIGVGWRDSSGQVHGSYTTIDVVRN